MAETDWFFPLQSHPGGLNDYLITSPEMLRQWALVVIKTKWGIRNPPPWLICAMTGESYKLV